MANKIGRIIIGIVIVAALAFVIYTVLPGQYKNPLKATLQSKTNSNYEDVVGKVKGSLVYKNKDFTYEDMMISATANPAWTMEEISVDDNGNGAYDVYADGYKTTVSFENEDNSDGMVTHTNAHVRLTFHVTKDGSDVKIGDQVIEPDMQIAPEQIDVATSTYKKSDSSTYFQKTLDALCGK